MALWETVALIVTCVTAVALLHSLATLSIVLYEILEHLARYDSDRNG